MEFEKKKDETTNPMLEIRQVFTKKRIEKYDFYDHFQYSFSPIFTIVVRYSYT